MTLHLERESTHQGVVMSITNRGTDYFEEIVSPFDEADKDWAKLLITAAGIIAVQGPKLIARDERGRRVMIEDEGD